MPLRSDTTEAIVLKLFIQAANTLLKVRMNRMKAARRLTVMVTDISTKLPSVNCLGISPQLWTIKFCGFMDALPTTETWDLYPFIAPER